MRLWWTNPLHILQSTAQSCGPWCYEEENDWTRHQQTSFKVGQRSTAHKARSHGLLETAVRCACRTHDQASFAELLFSQPQPSLGRLELEEPRDYHVSGASHLSDACLHQLSKACPALTSLQLANGARLSDDAMVLLLSQLKSLKVLDLHACIKLKEHMLSRRLRTIFPLSKS